VSGITTGNSEQVLLKERGSPMKRALTRLLIGAGTTIAIISFSTSVAFAGWIGSCEHCDRLNAPNETIHRVGAKNASGLGVCAILWKYNGGSNYNVERETCNPSSHIALAEVPSALTGHGEAEAWFLEFTYTLDLEQS
jgi:hypothetical protein